MKLKYLRDGYLAQLKEHVKKDVKSLVEYYKEENPWLDSFFEGEDWYLESNISVPEVELIFPENGYNYDLENTKILYSAYKDALTLTQATDERLWAYLTHITFWNYMKVRWPVAVEGKDNNKSSDFVISRYFFMSNIHRAYVRNGLARLWFYGYITYEEERHDPFELTRMLLKDTDIAQTLLERLFSNNNVIIKNILDIFCELEKSNSPIPNRDQVREIAKYLNRIGGITVIDTFEEEEIREILYDKIQEFY